MKLMIKGAYVLMPLTYVACLLVAFLKCIPFNHQWQIYPNPGSKSPDEPLPKYANSFQTAASQLSPRFRPFSSWS